MKINKDLNIVMRANRGHSIKEQQESGIILSMTILGATLLIICLVLVSIIN